MTGVAELLESLAGDPPVQRVRNYHLTDREARPRPRDFLTAMRRSDGALCLRWPGPPGDCVVRYAPDADSVTDAADSVTDAPDSNWECAGRNRFRGRTSVESVDADRVRSWLKASSPELVTYESVRDAFEGGRAGGPSADAGGSNAIADGGRPDELARVRVERYADLRDDPDLDRADADALATALPAPPGGIVFRLPRVLATESVLEPVAGSDRVFAAELVPERETESAHYVRQDRRGCWVPKSEATAYELADGATVDAETNDVRDSPESA